MSILDGRKNNFLHVFAGISKAIGVILAMWCVLSAEAVAGCGFVDARIFLTSPTYKFIDGGYTGFSTLAGKTIADCYASVLQEKGLLGKELLSTLNAGNSSTEINALRGLAPATKLFVAHRGGPDWANGIPDNSVAAFKQSISRGVSSVELDLQMDKNRNLIAFHDASFTGMVRSDDAALAEASTRAIQDFEWITKGNSRKLDESKLLKLRRVIPDSFTSWGTDGNSNPILMLSQAASLADASIVVSSLNKVLSEIQTASNTQFKSKTAVNIFLDAAKSREITIATINRLRRYQKIAQGVMFNDIGDVRAVPEIKSIAVQFRINHFPNGADDLAKALCESDENKIIYKKSVVVVRQRVPPGLIIDGAKVSQVWNPQLRRDITTISYSDSTDNFSTSYGSSRIVSDDFQAGPDQMNIGIIYSEKQPLQLWGDAASRTCNTNHLLNSGIALVPVVEEVLPFKVTLDANGNSKVLNNEADFARAIMDFLKPFKTYFKMNIIEFSYTPLDQVSYYPAYYPADGQDPVKTRFMSKVVYDLMAKGATDSDFSNQPYIYQTFNRFFDINLVKSTNPQYNGPYLCYMQVIQSPLPGTIYGYACKKQTMGSTDEQKFEYRAKPGFYTGACNMVLGTQFRALPFGLTTTDNLMLETYLQGIDFQNNDQLLADFCLATNENNRMSDYTTRYRSFVGNPSFRLSGGI